MPKQRQPFTNATMREPRPGKPHIALIDGLWRVSPWKRGTGPLYYQAHAFVNRLNNRILWPVVDTVEQLNELPPGTYTLTGCASEEMARRLATNLLKKELSK